MFECTFWTCCMCILQNLFGQGKWETWIISDQICVSYFKSIGWYFLSDKAKYHLYFTIVHFFASSLTPAGHYPCIKPKQKGLLISHNILKHFKNVKTGFIDLELGIFYVPSSFFGLLPWYVQLNINTSVASHSKTSTLKRLYYFYEFIL